MLALLKKKKKLCVGRFMQRCKAAVNRNKRKSDALLPFSPLIEYEKVNFRLKKVASFQAKKVNNLNGIEKR